MDAATPSRSGARPVYSIGAVARMLDVEAATIRAWEERYGVVLPARSRGSQRLFSREQVEQLRFVLRRIEEGSSPADAHRLLQEQLGGGTGPVLGGSGRRPLVLLAERDRYTVELVEYLLRAEAIDVSVVRKASRASGIVAKSEPDLSIVEVAMASGMELCRRLAAGGRSPVLALSSLDLADAAIAVGASAFLRKPLEPLQFVAAVGDLLEGALTGPVRTSPS